MEDGKPTILVIEDEPSLQLMLEWELENLYTVIITANGQEALDKLEEFTPSIILLDLMMPVMDGFAFLQELEKREKKAFCPIIVLTAFANLEDDVLQLKREGHISAILIKPFHFTDLLLEEVAKLIK